MFYCYYLEGGSNESKTVLGLEFHSVTIALGTRAGGGVWPGGGLSKATQVQLSLHSMQPNLRTADSFSNLVYVASRPRKLSIEVGSDVTRSAAVIPPTHVY